MGILHKNPVTVISGSNKSGKTTALLSIACSHFEFKKRNYTNGKLERQTWKNVLKLTNHDTQGHDWTYHLQIKSGGKLEWKRGQRKLDTKKWNGLGKKESQIKNVDVVYLDLDRILPARHHSPVLHKKAKTAIGADISTADNQTRIEDCLSYILEEKYALKKLADHLGKDVFSFSTSDNYSSYNSASGEDVLSRILIECIESPKNSLILIDELELGLHPKIQRRLMDVIFEISSSDEKQFIITSHSSTVISCVPESARIFIETNNHKSNLICPISINSALSKMDSENYPLLDIFCEDEVSKWFIQKILQEINNLKIAGFYSELFNVITCGSADLTYKIFKMREQIYDQVKIKSGHACILDGDMKNKLSKEGSPLYPNQRGLYFLPVNSSPEKILSEKYEAINSNPKFRYHIEKSNPHCLLDKMVEFYGLSDRRDAFNASWITYKNSAEGIEAIKNLIDFLKSECQHYLPLH